MQLKMEAGNQGKSKQQSSPQPPLTTAASSPAAAGSSTSPAQQHQNGSSSTGVVSNGAKFRPRSTTTPSSTVSAPASSNPWSQQQQYRFNNTLPMRILVLKDLVGAIIGRGGNTIKQITQETHARVDVHRKESSTANENVIMIYGSPENCSQACRRILEVMQQEARSLNRPEDFVLKILASNTLIGRIIGKGGNTIKRIMQQTDTKITVSSANLASQINLERIISIIGQLDNMCKAEGMIMHKLRQCFESDMYQYQQSFMYAGLASPIPPVMAHHPQAGPLNLPAGYPAGPHSSHGQAALSYSLSAASQSLSGRQGVMASQASTSSSSGAPGPASHHLHSLPSPTGPPPAAYYSYNLPYIYQPPPGPATAATIPGAYNSGPSGAPYLSMGGYIHPAAMANMDNVKETATVYIPNSVVGAIIGRGGQTIRDMMINSGASIKVTQLSDDDHSTSSPSPTTSSVSSQDSSKSAERRVTIIGSANSQCQAQFFVFHKVYAELCNQAVSSSSTASPNGPYGDPLILKVEILVPTNLVRRIIGKSGSVIQELQRTTGATIKLSKDTQHHHVAPAGAPPNGATDVDKSGDKVSVSGPEVDMTAVHIIGDFTANFAAQRQIRLIVMRSTSGQSSSHPSPQLVHASHSHSHRSAKSTTAISAIKSSSKSASEASDTSKSKVAATAATTLEPSSTSAVSPPLPPVTASQVEQTAESKPKAAPASTTSTTTTSSS